MLIKDVPVGDFNQIFGSTILFCVKINEWVFVCDFSADIGKVTVRVMSLTSRLQYNLPFNDVHFQVKAPKLGMVNVAGHAVFCARLPKRVMKGALTSDTLVVSIPYYNRNVAVDMMLTGTVREFSKEVVDTFNGVYPTFAESLKRLVKDYCVAFDRQFCVNRMGNIYYKGNKQAVGVCDITNPAIPIKWNEGFEGLEFVVGDKCAKALQASKQAPRTRIARD